MFRMWDVRDGECLRCEMFSMWVGQCVGCLRCGMFWMLGIPHRIMHIW